MKPNNNDDDSIEVGKEKVQGESDQEMMSLENEIYSLTHYADDEEELVAQMFATIKGSKLEAMMPPILKEIPLIDVQQLCLHELRGMSQRRILSIINGQEMSGSSSDEDSDDNRKTSKIQDENEDSNMGSRSMDDGEVDNRSENLTAMDILELEMRAKLIKTMLEKQDGDEATPDGFDPDIKIKEEPISSSSHSRDDSRSPKALCRKRYSRHRKRGSDSYSSSRSSTGSGSRSRKSYSSERKQAGSESPQSRKPSKKKITKKEFVARMKKAKQNRSYRKRKDSEDDSGEKLKKNRIKKRKEKADIETALNGSLNTLKGENLTLDQENMKKEKGEVEEENMEGDAGEREEGELDSNDDGAYSSSRSRSGSYTSSSYSSFSSGSRSRSRSYSRSPRRRRKSKRKSRKSRRENRSPSAHVSAAPKVPNWPEGKVLNEPAVDNPETIVNKVEMESMNTGENVEDKTLPSKEGRQSISFSINKKAPIKTNPELNDDALPGQTPLIDNKHETVSGKSVEMENILSDREDSVVLIKNVDEAKVEELNTDSNFTDENMKHDDQRNTKSASEKISDDRVEGDVGVADDFYKGADQLYFSEEDEYCDEEALDKVIHKDTAVEAICITEDIVKNTQFENLSKKDSLECEGKKDPVITHSAVDSPLEELNDAQKEDLIEEISHGESLTLTGEEGSQEAFGSLPDSELSQETHSLEIIGVIDPKVPESAPESYDELAEGGSSWSMRWLNSEKVQKVVSNSKMLSKVRKNIQAKGKEIVKVKPPAAVVKTAIEDLKPELPKVEPKPVKKSTGGVIGSIDEYEKMFGIKVKAPTSLPQPKPSAKAVTPQHTSQSMALLDSDDDEDSEEEALWSKILKK